MQGAMRENARKVEAMSEDESEGESEVRNHRFEVSQVCARTRRRVTANQTL
jgi:hypothetical protein